ncbi:MAG: DNA-primase RepB domain-containing protein [Afipia sp.]|nr:DNA-primase RepB domain-containing protein [Afipia sp.]
MNFRIIPESKECLAEFAKMTPAERMKISFKHRGRLSKKPVVDLLKRKNAEGYAIFFTLNATDGNGVKRENVVAVRALPLDMDGAPLPDKFEVEPSLIVNTSPGKFQCFWPISESKDFAAYEDMARRLAAHYGGDPAVCDVAHVFRAAGFYHWKGNPFRSGIIKAAEFEPPVPIESFGFLPKLPPRADSTASGVGSIDADKARLILGELNALDFAGNVKWLALAMAMHAASAGDSEVRDLFLEWSAADPDYADEGADTMNRTRWESFRTDKPNMIGIGTLQKICRDHGVSDDTIAKVFNDAADDFDDDLPPDDTDGDTETFEADAPIKLNEVNPKNIDEVFALVNIGSKIRILYWGKSTLDLKVRVPEFWAENEFHRALKNKFVNVETKVTRDDQEKTETKRLPLSSWWMSKKTRYTFDGLRFDSAAESGPGQDEINMWRGFGVDENADAKWNRLDDHIRDVIAGGDVASYDYIKRWIAWGFQNPTAQSEVALALLSEGKGTGKGFLGRALCRIYGGHALHIAKRSLLTGRFNSHFMMTSFVFCDEALWPGYAEDEGALQTLISEPTIMIEPKGIDAFMMPNALKVLLASNSKWVLPASGDDRRYAAFEVSDQHKQDKPYFARIAKQLDNGGLGAMLHDLRAMDLEGWHPRNNIPQTSALAGQKRISMKPEFKWLAGYLEQGVLDYQHPSHPEWVDAGEFYTHARRNVEGLRRWTDIEFADFLRKWNVQLKRSNGSWRVFPPLAEMREQWTKQFPWWGQFDKRAVRWGASI